MDKITFQEQETLSGLVTFVFIENADGSITSMPKSVWDEQQAAKEASGTLS